MRHDAPGRITGFYYMILIGLLFMLQMVEVKGILDSLTSNMAL